MLSNDIRKCMLDTLTELISIPTVNFPPDGCEREGQDYIKAKLAALGMDIDEFSPADLPEYPSHPEFLPRNHEGRNNIVATWKGTGGGKSLLLTGHMDVVPKEPLPWTVTEPFTPLIKDGRVYGRGAADMKGGIACGYAALKLLKDSGFAPKGDILFETVVDEEYAGANGTIASRFRGHNADFAIVLEPNGLNVCPACVGGMIYRLSVKGMAGMPYTGEEITNPAYDIAEIVNIIKLFSEWRMSTTKPPKLWEGTVQGAQVVIIKLKAGEAYESGQLSAPIDAWCEIVLQSYPGETEPELYAQLKAFIDSHYHAPEDITIEPIYHYCRPAATDPEFPGVKLLSEIGLKYTDKARICGAMFSCDMFALTEIGHMPAALFGPAGERLHAPDEYVDIASMEVCVETLADFIREWYS